MDNTLILPALIRLLDFSSIRRFKLKDKEVNFKDEIGKKAIGISDGLKNRYNIDIFSKSISSEDLNKFEHLIGNAMSNYTNNKLVLRKVNDEVNILKESKPTDSEIFKNYKISFSESITEDISKIKGIKSNELLEIIKNPDSVTFLEGENNLNQYFAQSTIELNNRSYYIVSTLRHESRKKDELNIISFIPLNKEQYSSFNGNPTQLFLKGLDKYGIDLNINNTLSRYYRNVEVPLTTKTDSVDFLNLKNIDKSESFQLAMALMKTENSIKLNNVFAIKTKMILNELNK
jgi:hypothetical protein